MENYENQKEFIITEENGKTLENIFQLDYLNQNLSGNNEFIKWKNLNIKKYGNNYRLFKCSMDKLLFMTTNSNCKSYPFYQCICPKCNNPICYFCSRFGKDSFYSGSCCLRRRIYCMIFEDGLKLIKPLNTADYLPKFEDCFQVFIIPIYNLLYFMKEMHGSFFYKLTIKKAKPEQSGYLENYEDYIQRNSYFILQLVAGINIAFAIILSIPLTLVNIYFNIFILIISIPFKLYPLKYILGIGYEV